MSLPEVFCERLRRILPGPDGESVLQSFSRPRRIAVRVNSLKVSPADALEYLTKKNLHADTVPWYSDALILDATDRAAFRDDPWTADGKLYLQNLSSMTAPVVLDPQPGERVLDLCAAPGSKTTQMAQMMRNEGSITAVEAIRSRFFKLKSVCELIGATIVKPVCCDGRRYQIRHVRGHGDMMRNSCSEEFRFVSPQPSTKFDRILVDAPCSSEGLFDAADPETTRYWSKRKIDEMSKKQRGLLLSASRLLKPGGTMVYSTCSFAPEENEGTVDWFLKKAGPGFRCVPIVGHVPEFASNSVRVPRIETAAVPELRGHETQLRNNCVSCPRGAPVLRWEKRVFHPDVQNCVRILPGEDRIGFFIAKFMLK